MPGNIKRVFYIKGKEGSERGGHRHVNTWHALVCVAGKCRIWVDNGEDQQEHFSLDSSEKCLILEPNDWHTMDEFTDNTVLLVVANQYYNPQDYIYQPYYHNLEIPQFDN